VQWWRQRQRNTAWWLWQKFGDGGSGSGSAAVVAVSGSVLKVAAILWLRQ
jgi:hypothetical protein